MNDTENQPQKINRYQRLGLALSQVGLFALTQFGMTSIAEAKPSKLNNVADSYPTIIDHRQKGNPAETGPQGAGEGFDRSIAEIEKTHGEKINHFIAVMPNMMQRLVHKTTNTVLKSEVDLKNYDLGEMEIHIHSSPTLIAEIGSPDGQGSVGNLAYGKPPAINLSTAFLAAITDEDELAAVLSHEIHHSLRRQKPHILRPDGSLKYQDGSIFSRKQDEGEADASTILRLTEAGYRPGALINVMGRFIDIYGDKTSQCAASDPHTKGLDPEIPCTNFISPYPDYDPHGTKIFRSFRLLHQLDAFCEAAEKSRPTIPRCPTETKKGLTRWRELRGPDAEKTWSFNGTWAFLSGKAAGDEKKPQTPRPKL
jgi:hypothetical protein